VPADGRTGISSEFLEWWLALQKLVGFILLATSLLSAVYNGFHFIFNQKPDILLGLVFSLIGTAVFLVSVFIEQQLMKLFQTVFMAAVAVFTIKLNDEPLFGALILLAVFSLWIAWGFYEKYPFIFIPASVLIQILPFQWVYGNFQKSLITTIGVSAIFCVLWTTFNHMAKNKHEELLRNYDELLKINNELLKYKGAGSGNDAGKA
jgi:uncharacterized membrane protein YqjE